MKKTIAIVAVAMMGLTVSASAFTFEKNKLSLDAGFIYSMPQGDTSDSIGSALGLGVSGDYQIADNMKVGLELARTSYGESDDMNDLGFNYDLSILNFGPTFKYFIAKDKLTYFGVFGIGMYSWSMDAITGVQPKTDGTDMGFSIGGGATYAINEKWGVGADLRYHTVGGDIDADFINLGIKGTYKF